MDHRETYHLPGIKPLELLLAIPDSRPSIAAAPADQQDASGLREPPWKAQLCTSLCLQVGGVRRPKARHATSKGLRRQGKAEEDGWGGGGGGRGSNAEAEMVCGVTSYVLF
jgi:hypothetical protein